MKLSPEVIESAAQYINPATKDREIDLRNYKITTIENLGATLDQFDCIDFSDNDIRRLENFPLLKRLKKLTLNNNRISRIDPLNESLPNLETIILTNNHIQELGDIEVLSSLPKLQCLSLLNNPVATKKYYRLFVVHKIPQLRLLDFRKVKLQEKEEATKLFKGSKGKLLEKEIGVKSKTFTPGGDLPAKDVAKPAHTPADVEAIKAAIGKAQTLEEIERLNQLLKSGYIPGKSDVVQKTTTTEVEIEENEEMENVENGHSN